MTYALIDNASLTSAQRVMGQITVNNPDTINGDLVALENLVQAILFYDDLVCIDNYKEEHQKERGEVFNFIKFISPTDYQLDSFSEKAKIESKLIRPEIRGGEFADPDFRGLLESLKLNMVCTWDLRSSVYYLTMKMLGQPNTPEYEKYSALSSAIYNELSDAKDTFGHWSADVKLVGSDGTEYTKKQMEEARRAKFGLGGTTHALDMFIASLNWLAFKSIYYSLAAKHLKADTFLHPIRHAYQIHWLKKTGAFGHDFTAKLVDSLSSKLSNSIGDIVDNGRSTAVSLDIPIFSAWLSVQSGDSRDIITSALALKNEQCLQDVRGILREIRIGFDEDGITQANKSIQKWEKQLKRGEQELKSRYGIKTDQGIQGSLLVKVYNSIAALSKLPQFPEFDFKVPLPDFIRNNNSSSFSTIFKYVASELTSIERLGSVRDLMAANFSIHDGRYVPPKTEAPEHRNHTSGWKIPM